jgi:hypothetical protein
MDGSTGSAVTRSDIGPRPARLLLHLLARFHQQNITYCYWKSSQRVQEVLTGESDLDLLIAKDDQHRVQQILLYCGFKCFPSVSSRDHPAISSFLGFDEESGRIVHVHCHFRLVMGEKLFKDYRVPWEETLLSRAIEHQFFPIRILDPTDEALLLVVRSCLEFRRMDPITLRDWANIRRRFESDRSRLAMLLDAGTVQTRAAKLLPSGLAEAISNALFGERRFGSQWQLRRRIFDEFAPRRMCNFAEARVRCCVRSLLWGLGGLNGRFFHFPRTWRRRAPGGGCVVAILGVDGSGKSTIVAAMRSWLGSELDVVPIYFGTGAGRPSLILLPLKLLLPLVTRLFVTKPKGASHGKISNHSPGPVYGVFLMLWAAVLAAEKRSKLLAARRGAERGLIVLADRYPQNEDLEYNDGPLLPRLSWAPQWLRNFESRAYALARKLPPDLVIKLDVTPETAARREPDMDPAVTRARIGAVRKLTFPGARVMSVDAERPLADVLGVVKQAIWQLL